MAQRRCGPLANGWPEFAESARGGPPVGSWRWGVLQRRPPRAWGRQRMKARATMPHPTETRLAESIRGLCCIDLVLGHTARWEKARHIRGYFDGVPCREKHQLPPRGFFPVPSAVSLFILIEEAVLSAVANHGCIVRTLRVPSSWASFEHSMGRPGTTLCSPKKKRINR